MNIFKTIIQFFKDAQRETSIKCLLEERERNKEARMKEMIKCQKKTYTP